MAVNNPDCEVVGLVYADSFDSTIHFPREKATAFGYEEVLEKHDICFLKK